jgi:hypothetical protein
MLNGTVTVLIRVWLLGNGAGWRTVVVWTSSLVIVLCSKTVRVVGSGIRTVWVEIARSLIVVTVGFWHPHVSAEDADSWKLKACVVKTWSVVVDVQTQAGRVVASAAEALVV